MKIYFRMRIVQTLRLKNDPDLIKEYIDVHRNIWPEIREGILKVGITDMQIFINENVLFMIIDTIDDFDREKAFAKLATLPLQKDWEELVAKFQDCKPGASSGDKWIPAVRIFKL